MALTARGCPPWSSRDRVRAMSERSPALQTIYRWELAKLLLMARPCRIYHLAKILDCTERTVHRYFGVARELGYVLVYSTKTRCWRLEGQAVDPVSVAELLEGGLKKDAS